VGRLDVKNTWLAKKKTTAINRTHKLPHVASVPAAYNTTNTFNTNKQKNANHLALWRFCDAQTTEAFQKHHRQYHDKQKVAREELISNSNFSTPHKPIAQPQT
jgi:hypothetical protein